MKQVAFFLVLAVVFMAAATVAFAQNAGASAQKEKYDVVFYSLPAGWKKEVKENGVQIYTGNEKTGEYAVALIIKSSATDVAAGEGWAGLWQKLVKGTVTVSGEPVMGEPSKGKGWDVVSGQAYYTDGGNKGLVTLVTATGGGKIAAIVLMANTDKYQGEMVGFLKSVEMEEVAGAAGADGNTVVGIWESNMSETSGMKFANGSPMLTAGYFRKAYTFKSDGTYVFLEKDFSSYNTEIFFAHEAGTWAVVGNQLVVTPVEGKNESWSKSASGNSGEWGSLKKSTARKLEKVSYTFEFHYYSGMNQTYLDLTYDKNTERDGRSGTKWSYKPPYTPGKPIIDWPPGARRDGGKAGGSAAGSLLAGKVWGGWVLRFVYVGASAYTETNVLKNGV
ncbi:MAG: hypothetical protein JST68_30555 [Bacteroidetes bacterium]|nr:hypothetical protein [Bacteroidota bacterium]